MIFSRESKVGEVRDFLKEKRKDGVECPCCDQYVKTYRRSISSAMAAGLIIVHGYFERNPDKQYVQVPELFKNNHHLTADFSKLKFWGFVEAMESKREDGSKRSGYYRITKRGKDFAEGNVTACKYVYVYNNTYVAYDDREMVDIHQALKNKFNYNELIAYEN